jgi:uncharacterized protein involved in outer membrane biogenesis
MKRLLLILAVVVAATIVIVIGGVYWLVGAGGALEQQLTAWLGQPVRIERAGVTVFPRLGLTLENVTVGEPAGATLGRVDISTGFRALLARRIEEAEVAISDSRIDMPLPFGIPGGSLTAGAGAAAGSVQLVSVRRIALQDIVLVSLGRELRVSGESALNGSRLAITRFTAASGDAALEAHGSIDFQPVVVANLQATSELLDIDALLAVASAFLGTSDAPGGDAPAGKGRVSVRVTAPRARAAGVDLGEFDAIVTALAGELAIDPMTFTLFGGRHEGWLSATHGDMLEVRIGSSVAGVDVAQLAEFGGSPGAISGRLSGTIRLGASGRDIGGVLASARGVGDASITNGSLSGLELVRTVLQFLGREGDAPRTTGSAFERMTATFSLADQRVTTEDLSLEAPDVDVLGRGSLELRTDRLDGRANLVLSDALSSQANRAVYRYTQMGNRVVLPATIGGTLSEPRIGIDAAAAVRRGVANEVERRLRDFFERVGPL